MPAGGRGGSGGEATGFRIACGTLIGVFAPRLEPRVGGARAAFPGDGYAVLRRRPAWRKTNASTSATAAKNSSGIICPISTSRCSARASIGF